MAGKISSLNQGETVRGNVMFVGESSTDYEYAIAHESGFLSGTSYVETPYKYSASKVFYDNVFAMPIPFLDESEHSFIIYESGTNTVASFGIPYVSTLQQGYKEPTPYRFGIGSSLNENITVPKFRVYCSGDYLI